MNRSPQSFIVALSISLLVAGCATPQPVRSLASQGAVNVDRAESETRAFVDRATQAYQRREAIVQGLAKGDLTDKDTADFNAWLAGEAGFDSDRTTSALIKKIADARKALREKIQTDVDKKSKEISGTFGDPVQILAKNFSETKKAFLILAQELSPQEWLEFGLNYAKQIRADIKAMEQLPSPTNPAK